MFARLQQPPVVAEMLAGFLLGPSLVGWLAPELSSRLFPASSLPVLSTVSEIGLILFMFLVGWRLDVGHLRSIGRVALVTGAASVAVPFALGSGMAVTVWYDFAPEGVGPLPFALFMGTALSITAFPVLVRILEDQRLMKTGIATLAVACAAFNDVTGWLVLAAATAIVRAGSPGDAFGPLAGLAVYAAVMTAVVRPAVARAARRRGAAFGTTPADMGLVLIVVLLSAHTTDALGVHALFGAFFAGVVMPRSERSLDAVAGAIEPITATLLLPLFFAVSGLRTNVALIGGVELWIHTLLILLVAVAGKGVGSALAARASGLAWPDAALIGVLLNTRGLVELVVLNIGLDLGILSPVLFSMMVLMAFATTLATSPLVSMIRSRTGPRGAGAPRPSASVSH